MQQHRIDVHRHVIPEMYVRAMRQAGVREPIAGVAYPRWDRDTDLAAMDRFGVQTAIVSITAPGVSFTSGQAAQRVARDTNEFLARLVEQHPDRYGAFALIPLPDVTGAIAEAEYALDVLGLDGIGLFTNHRGTSRCSRHSPSATLWSTYTRRSRRLRSSRASACRRRSTSSPSTPPGR